MSFLGAQQLLLQTVATDGEAFVRIIPGYSNKHGFSLQLIDPDMVDHDYNLVPGRGQNEVRMGIELNQWQAPVAYHVLTGYPGDGGRIERVRIQASEMLHLYRPDRIGQTRGTTWFNSAMKDIRNLDAYTEAEILAARISASKVGWLKPDPEFFTPEADKSAVEINADPGGLGVLAPGYDFVDWSPDHPANAFGAFLKACLRKIATGLRVSYNVLANDLEGVNYSSMRSGMLIEREQWKILQTWWTEKFLQPVFEAWLSAALLSGGLRLDSRDPNKFNAVRWLPRGWAWVDPLKDVQAAKMAIEARLTSRTKVMAEQGGDFEEVLEEQADEARLSAEYGVSLSTEEGASNVIQIDEDGNAIGSTPGSAPTLTQDGGDVGSVQDTALNGAQVESLLAIVSAVANGQLPIGTAKSMVQAAFPFIRPELVDSMLVGLNEFEPVEVDAGKNKLEAA